MSSTGGSSNTKVSNYSEIKASVTENANDQQTGVGVSAGNVSNYSEIKASVTSEKPEEVVAQRLESFQLFRN
jgi:hypothetical protein